MQWWLMIIDILIGVFAGLGLENTYLGIAIGLLMFSWKRL